MAETTMVVAAKPEENAIEYVPFGTQEKIKLTVNMVRNFLAKPTKSGKAPNDQDVTKFMMLCKARELNPWEGDSYLLGYDSQDGPEFSMVTAYQAFLKRAEACQEYDGKEQGVVVKKNGETKEITGEIVPEGYTLIGGWAKVYRKDRRLPEYQIVNLAPYDKQRSMWNKDKPGMIVKCAVAKALRHTFPNKLSQMYIAEERERIIDVQVGSGENGNGGTKAAMLTAELKQRAEKTASPAAQTNGEHVNKETGEVLEVEPETEKSEKVAQEMPQEAAEIKKPASSDSEKAPYPADWPERRKEKVKGYDLQWSSDKATAKFLDKLRKDGIKEAGYELEFRKANS